MLLSMLEVWSICQISIVNWCSIWTSIPPAEMNLLWFSSAPRRRQFGFLFWNKDIVLWQKSLENLNLGGCQLKFVVRSIVNLLVGRGGRIGWNILLLHINGSWLLLFWLLLLILLSGYFCLNLFLTNFYLFNLVWFCWYILRHLRRIFRCLRRLRLLLFFRQILNWRLDFWFWLFTYSLRRLLNLFFFAHFLF